MSRRGFQSLVCVGLLTSIYGTSTTGSERSAQSSIDTGCRSTVPPCRAVIEIQSQFPSWIPAYQPPAYQYLGSPASASTLYGQRTAYGMSQPIRTISRRPSPLATFVKFLLLQKIMKGGGVLKAEAPSPTVTSKWWSDPHHCRYLHKSIPMEYEDAVAYCKSVGGQVAAAMWRTNYHFEDSLARRVLLDVISESMDQETSFWVGARYVPGGVNGWVYTDDVIVDGAGVEGLECKMVVAIYDGYEINFEYNVDSCRNKHSFICESC